MANCANLLLLAVTATVASAGTIQLEAISGYLHADGALVTQLTSSSTGYFSTLDGNNAGQLGWTFTNSTSATMTNVLFFGFVDADLDRDLNSFFNEYGTFYSLSLLQDAPAGAIAPGQWQIDEPGYLFGTIVSDLQAGSLRNTNSVPSSAPDDVSLALGFQIGSLAPGQSVSLVLRIANTNIGGLQQVDPDSGSQFFLNGYAALAEPVSTSVPEPANVALLTLPVLFLFRRFLSK
ncbi:hypothetical protein F183_A21140 [Bryobacterales bacterium F-183]|nr:hypothetical protein F183_A21140 [Bryobacterales bacterium F-183]